jgi:predicted RND superfamily exporter protein
MKNLEASLGPWVVRNRWWVIVATVAIVVAIGSGVRFLSFNMDNRVFFSADNPQLVALENLEDTYVKTYNVVFIVAPESGDVFDRRTLDAVETLTEASWQIPYSSRVDSITNYQHTRAEEDDLIVANLVENVAELSDDELRQIRAITLSRPMLVDRLVSPSGHVTGINVNILLPGESQQEVPEVAQFVRELANDIKQQYPGIDIHMTGALMIDNGFGEITADDMSTLVPIMFLVLIVITGIALRSLGGTLATLLVILMSMLTGLGAAGWMGLQLNTASAVAPTIILTLAIADSVHILVAMFHKMHEGKGKADAYPGGDVSQDARGQRQGGRYCYLDTAKSAPRIPDQYYDGYRFSDHELLRCPTISRSRQHRRHRHHCRLFLFSAVPARNDISAAGARHIEGGAWLRMRR